MHSKALRDAVVALSLSNLLFLKGWIELFDGDRHPYFRSDTSTYWIDCVALLLDVLLLAAVFCLAVAAARRWRPRLLLPLAQWLFLLAVLRLVALVAGELRLLRRFPVPESGLPWAAEAALVAAGILLAIGAVRWALPRRARLVRFAVVGLLIFSPFVLITFSRALWNAGRYGLAPTVSAQAPAGQGKMVAPLPRGPAGQPGRLLWFVFDDLDYRLAFLERPPGVALPELDCLQAEAFVAADAYPPALHTLQSLPALTLGRPVARALPLEADELLLVDAQGRATGWSSQSTIFARARSAGFTTAAIGWHHPYCRLFSRTLDACAWNQFRIPESGLPEAMLAYVQQALPPVVRFNLLELAGYESELQHRRYHLALYTRTLAEATRFARDPGLNLIFVHWPIPHSPYLSARSLQEPGAPSHPIRGYFESLALVDRTVGDIRRALEESGLWDRTSVLITSDHPWREAHYFDGKRDGRVPFLLKVRGSDRAVLYTRRLETYAAADLLLPLLRGEVSSPEAVAQWLDRHRTAGASLPEASALDP